MNVAYMFNLPLDIIADACNVKGMNVFQFNDLKI